MDALKRAYTLSRQIASWAVLVDAKDAAVAFYKKIRFPGNSRPCRKTVFAHGETCQVMNRGIFRPAGSGV